MRTNVMKRHNYFYLEQVLPLCKAIPDLENYFSGWPLTLLSVGENQGECKENLECKPR